MAKWVSKHEDRINLKNREKRNSENRKGIPGAVSEGLTDT